MEELKSYFDLILSAYPPIIFERDPNDIRRILGPMQVKYGCELKKFIRKGINESDNIHINIHKVLVYSA